MKSWDIQDALSSFAEVAIFAWSLLEVLLTRILPLAAFLAGHLLLQLGSLLASFVTPAASRRNSPSAQYNPRDALQAEELIAEEDSLQVVKEEDDNQQRLTGTDDEQEESQRISGSLFLSLTSKEEDEDADAAAPPAVCQPVELPKSAPPEERVTDLHDAAGEEKSARGSESADVAKSLPSDVQRTGLRSPSDTVDHNLRHVADDKSSSSDVVGVKSGHMSPGGVGKMNFEPSDWPVSPGGAGKMNFEPSDGPTREKRAARRSGGRRVQVLPPSLSQVRRSVMQRSRRASPWPQPSSPAILAPSPSVIQKKQRSTRSRRGGGSLALRSSPSYNNFMRKFREHFLLDAP